MSVNYPRRRVRMRRYIPRKHGWPARIERQEQQAREECQQLVPFSIGWLFYFYDAPALDAHTWQYRKKQLADYIRWRDGYLAWRQRFYDTLQGWMNTIAGWYEQHKPELETLLAAREGEEVTS